MDDQYVSPGSVDDSEFNPELFSKLPPVLWGKETYTRHRDVLDDVLKQECFPAGTLIAMADGSEKEIQHIALGDEVLAPNGLGDLVPAKVDKLFENTTQEFVRLTFSDGRPDLTATPGHRFLTEAGDYMEIGDMLKLGGGSARLVDQSGQILTVKGEMLTYSQKTASMFETAA